MAVFGIFISTKGDKKGQLFSHLVELFKYTVNIK